jgi:hypothetical protein
MTLPNERTRSVINTQDFLLRLASPYGGGLKRIPKNVRDEARRLLRHYPHSFDLSRADCWDPLEALRRANREQEQP